MDQPFTEVPSVTDPELLALLAESERIYHGQFNGDTWLGRCIFLSFYCSVNTCDFCFRSVSEKSRHDPKKAMRSLGSILTEALLIKAFGWRIEFLTGGYGIADPKSVERIVRLVHQILSEPLWLNLGVLSSKQLASLRPLVGGVTASLETLEPSLHKKTCPDKPIAPYISMLEKAKEMGLQRSITLVIGLGEDRSHWQYVHAFLTEHPLERITVYALRPVQGTPYEHGPSPIEMAWWIAKIRVSFPSMEIIAGTAEYRSMEIPLLLRAGANAITKLPATKVFNTDLAYQIKSLVESVGRRWVSTLNSDDPAHAFDFETVIAGLDLTDQEKDDVRSTLSRYLVMMSKSSGGRRGVLREEG